MKQYAITIRLAVFALAIAIGLTACERKEERHAGPLRKVTLAGVQTFYAGLIHIALANNYFRDEGIDLTVQMHQTGVSALNALATGSADLASTAETPVMFAVTGGHQLKILANTFVSDKELAIVARKDHGVVAPTDLKGKKIAVSPGTVGEFFLHIYLAENHISPEAVEIVKLATNELVGALLAGKVDAASSWNPPVKKLRNEMGNNATTFTLTPPHSLIAILSCRPDLPTQEPELVQGILRALIRAETFVREHPQESIQLTADAIGMDRRQLDELWHGEDFGVSLDQSLLLSLEYESKWAIESGLTKASNVPNYLDVISFDGLIAVQPEKVGILR